MSLCREKPISIVASRSNAICENGRISPFFFFICKVKFSHGKRKSKLLSFPDSKVARIDTRTIIKREIDHSGLHHMGRRVAVEAISDVCLRDLEKSILLFIGPFFSVIQVYSVQSDRG